MDCQVQRVKTSVLCSQIEFLIEHYWENCHYWCLSICVIFAYRNSPWMHFKWKDVHSFACWTLQYNLSFIYKKLCKFVVGEIEAALQLSNEDFMRQYQFEKPEPNGPLIVVYCRSGVRSERACQTFQKFGYKKSVNIKWILVANQHFI